MPQLAGQSKHSLFQWSCSLQKLSSCPIISKHEVASHLGNKVGKWNTHSCKPSLHPHIFALLPFNCADKSPGSGPQGSLLHMGVLHASTASSVACRPWEILTLSLDFSGIPMGTNRLYSQFSLHWDKQLYNQIQWDFNQSYNYVLSTNKRTNNTTHLTGFNNSTVKSYSVEWTMSICKCKTCTESTGEFHTVLHQKFQYMLLLSLLMSSYTRSFRYCL